MLDVNLTAASAGGAEAIHQMRVAVRRLRVQIDLFHGVLHGSRVRACDNDLRWLGRSAGAARQCDVIAGLLRERMARLDPALSAAAGALFDALDRDRAAAYRRFADDLATARYRRMRARLADPLPRKSASGARVADLAFAMLAPIVRKARRAARRVRVDADPALIHRLRIRLKRVRYALETFAEIGGKRTRRALARLEDSQDLLGRHQDLIGAIDWLRGFGAAGAAPDVPPAALIAAGALLQDLARQREKLAARIVRRARRLTRAATLEAALREIARESRAAAAARGQSVAPETAEAELAAQSRAAPRPLAPAADRAASSAATAASRHLEPAPESPTTPTDEIA